MTVTQHKAIVGFVNSTKIGSASGGYPMLGLQFQIPISLDKRDKRLTNQWEMVTEKFDTMTEAQLIENLTVDGSDDKETSSLRYHIKPLIDFIKTL